MSENITVPGWREVSRRTRWWNRPYTGTKDAGPKPAPQLRPGVRALNDALCYLFGFITVGGAGGHTEKQSVHYTGRAIDLKYKKVHPVNPELDKDFRFRNINLLFFLSLNSDILGIEEIHDYCGVYVPGTKTKFVPEYSRGIMAPPEKYPERNMFGAGYRCDREYLQEVPFFFGWKIWDKEAHKMHSYSTIGSSHIHIEVSPTMASSEAQMKKMITLAWKKYRMVTTWPTFE